MEVVGDFSDSDSPIEREWGHIRLDAVDVITRLRITLGSDYVIGRVAPHSEHFIVEDLDFTFCTPYLEAWAFQRVHELIYDHEQREVKDSENTEGARDSRAHQGRVRDRLRQGGEAGEGITDPPPEEGLTRTSPDHHPDGCIATHTHSGSLEDA